MSTLTQILFGSVLDSPVIVEITSKVGEKALSVIKQHFTYSAAEISGATQQAFGYGVSAISIGVAKEKLGFGQKLLNAKITREFAEQIEQHYLQPFIQSGATSEVPNLAEFRPQTVKTLTHFAKHQDQLFKLATVTDDELSALISYRETSKLTDLVLIEMQRIVEVDDIIAAFLRFDNLLGDAILFFFREQLRQDDRLEKTQAALQREGLCLNVQSLQAAVQTTQQAMNQAAAEQSTRLVEIAQQLQQLQQTQRAWHIAHEQQIRFSRHFEQLDDLLGWAKQVHATLGELHQEVKKTHEDVLETKDLAAEILLILKEVMARQNLSPQIKPHDEFTQHNSTSRRLIQQAASQFKQLSPNTAEYSRLSIMLSSTLSSAGALDEAEQLLTQAVEQAHDAADQALAHFNLFQVQLRRKAYSDALPNLQAAITLNPQQYVLHNINKYPMRQLLGAGGMGCVLLCDNQDLLRNSEHQQVAVKCFWESRSGVPTEVFSEAIKMRDIASDYVPKPLDYGYADELNQQRAFFITEYLDGAIDGEAWLERYGPMDLDTGLQVGLQIAEGLHVAHQAGVYHLDLKPANVLLLKNSDNSVSVKIIDFGLSRVATSLRDDAAACMSQTGLSYFGAAVFGTLDYAPPEQRGYTDYGEPSVKSDIFAFGKTMYRLLTGDSPLEVEPERLESAPDWYELLSNCTRAKPANRPESAQELVRRLQAIEQTRTVNPNNNVTKTHSKPLVNRTVRQPIKPILRVTYSNNMYADQAKQRLQALQQEERAKRRAEQAQAQDKKAWQAARQLDTRSAYQSYLNGDTIKQYADQAQQRLQTLQQEERAKRRAEQAQAEDKNAWQAACAEQAQAEDKNAWQAARQQGTRSAYQAYLKGDTLKQYANQAEQRLGALKDNVFDFEVVTVDDDGNIRTRKQKQAGYETIDLGNGVTLDMVYIPGGKFMMGSPTDEKGREPWQTGTESPQHEVTIKPFWMAKYLVTQAQWRAVMGNKPSRFKRRLDHPVERVSWHDSVKFCQRLSEITGKSYHLPSEAQWEYACRAGTTTPFYFGPTITTDLANYDGYPYGSAPEGVFRRTTTDVGSFPPNAFGLYDMHGNVWEWCADPWHDTYKGAPTDGSVWEIEKTGLLAKLFGKKGDAGPFVLRGGAWNNDATRARSATHGNDVPTDRINDCGFRPARIR